MIDFMKGLMAIDVIDVARYVLGDRQPTGLRR